MPKLNNWCVVARDRYTGLPPSLYSAPESVDMRLKGTVTGHPKHDDGTMVTTGPITEVTEKYVRTHHSLYELLEPDPGYETAFPNARQRLIEAWKV